MPSHKNGGVRSRAAGVEVRRREHARSRELERAPITAYPRAPTDELGSIPPPESGLSIDPEDLGSQFLSHATERASDFPTEDAALDGGGANDWGGDDAGELASGFDLDPDGWERALTRALRVGSLRPIGPRSRGARAKRDEEQDAAPNTDDIDLTDEAIHEASLFDHEGNELGEVESPELRTEDTRTHCKRRGGHAPAKRKHTG